MVFYNKVYKYVYYHKLNMEDISDKIQELKNLEHLTTSKIESNLNMVINDSGLDPLIKKIITERVLNYLHKNEEALFHYPKLGAYLSEYRTNICIGNENYFEKRKVILEERAKILCINYSLIFFRIDNLGNTLRKNNNALIEIADIIKKDKKNYDILAKVDENKLALLKYNSDIKDTYEFCNNIYPKIMSINKTNLGFKPDVTIGAANFKETTEYPGQLNVYADKALEISMKLNLPYVWTKVSQEEYFNSQQKQNFFTDFINPLIHKLTAILLTKN